MTLTARSSRRISSKVQHGINKLFLKKSGVTLEKISRQNQRKSAQRVSDDEETGLLIPDLIPEMMQDGGKDSQGDIQAQHQKHSPGMAKKPQAQAQENERQLLQSRDGMNARIHPYEMIQESSHLPEKEVQRMSDGIPFPQSPQKAAVQEITEDLPMESQENASRLHGKNYQQTVPQHSSSDSLQKGNSNNNALESQFSTTGHTDTSGLGAIEAKDKLNHSEVLHLEATNNSPPTAKNSDNRSEKNWTVSCGKIVNQVTRNQRVSPQKSSHFGKQRRKNNTKCDFDITTEFARLAEMEDSLFRAVDLTEMKIAELEGYIFKENV